MQPLIKNLKNGNFDKQIDTAEALGEIVILGRMETDLPKFLDIFNEFVQNPFFGSRVVVEGFPEPPSRQM